MNGLKKTELTGALPTSAVDSRIRIGGVGSIELVAISNPSRFTAVFELLHELQVVIAGDTKDVANTSFLKAAKQKVSNRLFHNAYPLSVVGEPHPISGSFR